MGKVFAKETFTRTLAGEEPMVCLDAAAITARIGTITHPARPAPPAPIYQSMADRTQPTEAKWRRALRPRPIS